MSTSPRYMPVAEVAKHVRATLKERFPAVKFSVRSRSYSMGASMDVAWTDGPTKGAVDAVVQAFAGATFDGMTDSKDHKPPMIIAGEVIRSGADFIFVHRELSDAAWVRVATAVAEKFNVPVPARANADTVYPVIGGRREFSQYVRIVANDRTELDRI